MLKIFNINSRNGRISAISQSRTFPTKPLNQSRRILHWGRFRRNGRIFAEFRTRGRFTRNGRINPAEFRTRDVSAETAVPIPPNFCRISHSGTFSTKRPNFRPISPSATFPTKWPNFRKILHSRTFSLKRPNFRPISQPNFRRISHSGTFPTKRPNQCRRISAEFHTRGRFRRNGQMNPA
ncbi:MAG: hypothetical protein Q8881_02865 [Sweet potato little leaf phytoplasma]|nr:hypothetical protein [Sweet potato little leaf phytoplasma]